MAKKRAGQERLIRVPAAGSPTDGKRAEDVLRPIVDGITSQVGEQFFRALVRHLAAALNVRFSFISEQLDHEDARLRLVAFWAGDDYGENFEYPTKGTPCELVVGKGLASFPSGLRELFPDDAWLREVGAESYLAIPLFDSIGAPLGHLGVMHDAPMREEHLNEQILRIFAERAGGELERKRAEEALRQSEGRYRELVENINDVIYEIDTNGRITYISPVAEEVSGYSPTEIIGRSIVEFMPPEEVPARMDSFGEGLAGRPVPTEFRLVSKSGEIRWIHTLGRVLREGDRITGFRGVLTDITDRKRAEDALRESEARNRALLELNPDMLFRLSKDGVYLEFIPGKHAKPLIPPDEFLGKRIQDVLPKNVAEQAALSLERALRTGEVQTFEHKLTIDDEIRDFEARVIAISEDEGLAIVRDITERKRAEEALRESEERYRALVETSPDGISLTDLEGRVLFCNKQALALLGFESMQEVLGRNAFDLIAPEDRQRAVDNAQRTLRMKSLSHVEYTLVRKDGSRFPAEMGASLVVDAEEEPKGFIGVVRDITARKRAEEAMRESEERFRTIFVEGPLGMAVVGLDYRLVRVNQTLCRMLGYSEAELAALTFPEITHPDDIDADVQLAERVFSGEIPHYRMEKRFIRQDGETVWGSMTTSVIRDERGNPLYGLGMVEDITERKRVEEALQEAREELESRVETQLQRGNTYGLTFRELTVIHLVAAGKSDKEIGALLGISPRTANKHVQNILTKLGASSRTEAGVRAVREGLVD